MKLLLTETGRSVRKQHFWMEEQEIGLRHSTFETPARPPSGDVKWEVRYVTLQYNLKALKGPGWRPIFGTHQLTDGIYNNNNNKKIRVIVNGKGSPGTEPRSALVLSYNKLSQISQALQKGIVSNQKNYLLH